MFEQFGALPANSLANGGFKDDITFRLFVPFSTGDRTDQSQIKSIAVTGSFIERLPDQAGNNWKILPEFP